MSGRILMLHTGGTIGMERSPQGYRPMTRFSAIVPQHMATLSGLPDYDLIELAPLIDSANLLPSHWARIARTLRTHWNQYDGFVILHGTDTLAWTASALSFMFQSADRPIILTGAQIPLLEPRSDALANLGTALILASSPANRGVTIFFGGVLLQGNRSTKSSSTDFQAFSSPNAAPLARAGISLPSQLPAPPTGPMPNTHIDTLDDHAVTVLTVYPGLCATQIEALTQAPALRGLILCSYGTGNLPDADPSLLQALARAVESGIVVVNRTQCAQGSVVHGTYATSSTLERIGIISASDMTLEAAFAKLHILLALHRDPQQVRVQFRIPLCGEMS
ncbi:asparaginase [Alcaligenes sp. 13f]|uniref:asparaginase n=1 Tax=Alcaligenes sp. 13f TaxID=2841924 RepID=UPI001CF70D7E|nr:asparaginase [Alcaligenes sp. 13f]MCB4320635.1 asparaginase [Alcaligenes sp. 13f]